MTSPHAATEQRYSPSEVKKLDLPTIVIGDYFDARMRVRERELAAVNASKAVLGGRGPSNAAILMHQWPLVNMVLQHLAVVRSFCTSLSARTVWKVAGRPE